MEQSLLDERQAAEYLGNLSVRTLQRKRMDGDGPVFVKLGKLIRYRPSDLDSYVAANVRGSTSEAA
ncbi:MAG: helix-turn-helix domain-containing protein [Proteobacteria bacterium]|nr:helix-turn-helix domain-containing protein [Pseudomonadota bacterium]